MITPGQIGIASGVLQIASFWAMIRPVAWPRPGQHRQCPQRVSWLCWVLLYQVMFWSTYARGATGSLWIVGAEVAGTMIMFVLSLRWGAGSLRLVRMSRAAPHLTVTNWPDLLVLVGTAAGLAGWQITASPGIGITCTVAVDTVAALPLIGLLLREPDTVSLPGWGISGLASLAALFSVSPGQPMILYLYPAAGLVLDAVIVGAILTGHRARRHQARHAARRAPAVAGGHIRSASR